MEDKYFIKSFSDYSLEMRKSSKHLQKWCIKCWWLHHLLPHAQIQSSVKDQMAKVMVEPPS